MMKTFQNQWVIFIKSFGFLCVTLLLSAFTLFYFVLLIFRGVVFGLNDSPIWFTFIYRGVNFREIIETPSIYLLSISFVSALVGAFWIAFVLPRFSRFAFIQILILPWLAVILTGPIWGFIWSVNHWPVQGFASYETMMLFRRTDIETGLSLSLLSAAQSYPLNIFSYSVFCGLLLATKRFFLPKKKNYR